MFNLTDPQIQFALQAVRQAALMVRHVQQAMISPALTKQDRSPVTVADYASQAVVGRLLASVFPDDRLVAEEDSTALQEPENAHLLDQVTGFVNRMAIESAGAGERKASGGLVCAWIDHGKADAGARFWTLDPIDGTKGFLRGEQYAVALALVVDGQVQIGVLGCPNLLNASEPALGGEGSLVIGVRGQGAWTTSLENPAEFQPLRVSDIRQPSQARILRSVESGHTNIDQVGQFGQVLGVQASAVTMDSQAKYAVLAAGKGDLYLRLLSPDKPDYREKIWDQAAGSIVIEEAGGRVSDLDGKTLDFTAGSSLKNNRGILATNDLLHAEALKALQMVGA